MKTRKHKIEKNLLNIVFYDKPKNYFPDKGYNEIIHFVYSYDEKMLSDGISEKMQPRDLSGMSGGMFKRVYANGFELPLGIFLAQNKRKKALVGLDYSFVLAWLEASFNEFDEGWRMIKKQKN